MSPSRRSPFSPAICCPLLPFASLRAIPLHSIPPHPQRTHTVRLLHTHSIIALHWVLASHRTASQPVRQTRDGGEEEGSDTANQMDARRPMDAMQCARVHKGSLRSACSHLPTPCLTPFLAASNSFRLVPLDHPHPSHPHTPPAPYVRLASTSSGRHPSMSLINVTNVEILDNPTKFTNPFQFEITFECLPPGVQDGENTAGTGVCRQRRASIRSRAVR